MKRERSEDEPLRVLHVIPGLGLGGAERVVLNLVRLTDRSRCAPSLCVLNAENAFPERLPGDVELDWLDYDGSLRNVRSMARCVRRLRVLIRERRPAIVHSHLWPATRIVCQATLGTGAAHLAHLHDTRPWLAGHSRRDRMMRVATNLMLRVNPPRCIAVSEAVKRYSCAHLALSEAAVEVMHNGVDLKQFGLAVSADSAASNRPTDRLRIGMAGRFSQPKRHALLLEAAGALNRQGLDFELLLAGEGVLEASCRKLADDLGIAHRVRFLGLVDDMPSMLRSLDVFVLPSERGEGLPMVILEAMASGVAVVATDTAGVPEVVDHEKNGLLVPVEDREALAAAIARLGADVAFRRQLADSGQRTVRDRFSFEVLTRRLESTYEAMCGARAGAATERAYAP